MLYVSKHIHFECPGNEYYSVHRLRNNLNRSIHIYTYDCGINVLYDCGIQHTMMVRITTGSYGRHS